MRPSLRSQLKKLPFRRKRAQVPRVLEPLLYSADPWTPRLLEIGLDPLRCLEQLVAIDSITPNLSGVGLVQKILGERLSNLDFELEWIKNPRGPDVSADLLVATLEPEKHKGPIRWINFVSHSDTVLGLDSVGPLEISDQGRIGRGSGVIDNKGGLVVALTGTELFLREQRSKGPRQFGLRFIISPNEEAGSIGFNDLFRAYGRDAILALGFEPALDNGNIIRSRRGNRWYHIKVTGTEGHAGRSRGEHVNAAHELAIKIAKMHKLNDPKNEIAVNIGRIEGGRDRFNVICGFAEAKLDVRFASFKAREELHRRIERILKTPSVVSRDRKTIPQVTYDICDDCPPFSTSSRSRKMVKELVKIIRQVEDSHTNAEVDAEMAGGAGDVNYMSDQGNIVIDGLGPIGGRMHTEEEFIRIPSLGSRSFALSRFLQLAEEAL